MSDDFISRKAAMDKINDIAAEFLKDHTIQCDIAAGVAIDIRNDVIKTLPAADVVEIVRCKDCKSCDQFYPNKKIGEEPKLGYFCKLGKHKTTADDFCSCGERRCEE